MNGAKILSLKHWLSTQGLSGAVVKPDFYLPANSLKTNARVWNSSSRNQIVGISTVVPQSEIICKIPLWRELATNARKEKRKPLLLVDLDGTLLTKKRTGRKPGGRPRVDVIEAIKTCKQSGLEFAIYTARGEPLTNKELGILQKRGIMGEDTLVLSCSSTGFNKVQVTRAIENNEYVFPPHLVGKEVKVFQGNFDTIAGVEIIGIVGDTPGADSFSGERKNSCVLVRSSK